LDQKNLKIKKTKDYLVLLLNLIIYANFEFSSPNSLLNPNLKLTHKSCFWLDELTDNSNDDIVFNIKIKTCYIDSKFEA
jgi:hypothetical protein